MPTTDPFIDAYIERSQNFAKPILNHIRAMFVGELGNIVQRHAHRVGNRLILVIDQLGQGFHHKLAYLSVIVLCHHKDSIVDQIRTIRTANFTRFCFRTSTSLDIADERAG